MAIVILIIQDTEQGVQVQVRGEPDPASLNPEIAPFTPAQQCGAAMLNALKFAQDQQSVEPKSSIILAGNDEMPL